MSEENFPEKNIVDKLGELGEALQGVPVEPGVYPPNFPGKKVADKIDELIGIVKEGGAYASKADLEQEIADREAYDAQQDQKIAALNGHYYPIEPYDFGKTLDVKTPVPEDVTLLNTYAMTMEGVTDPAQIIDGTVVKNLFDGIEFVWNAASQTWLDFGIGNIVTASNEHLGVVEGTPDPGDGSKDGFATVHPGGKMETLGFAALKTQVAGKVDTQQAAADAGKALLVGADGALILGKPAETDPNVPAWAKEPGKPTYTPSEVGAEPAFAKNTAFNKNFGWSATELVPGNMVRGLRLPAAFMTQLQQLGFRALNVDETTALLSTIRPPNGPAESRLYIHRFGNAASLPPGMPTAGGASFTYAFLELLVAGGSADIIVRLTNFFSHEIFTGRWQSGSVEGSIGWYPWVSNNTWVEATLSYPDWVAEADKSKIKVYINEALHQIHIKLMGPKLPAMTARSLNIAVLTQKPSWISGTTIYGAAYTAGPDRPIIVNVASSGTINFIALFPFTEVIANATALHGDALLGGKWV
jgi:hypothetical protein